MVWVGRSYLFVQPMKGVFRKQNIFLQLLFGANRSAVWKCILQKTSCTTFWVHVIFHSHSVASLLSTHLKYSVGPKNSSNPSWHGFNKMLETFLVHVDMITSCGCCRFVSRIMRHWILRKQFGQKYICSGQIIGLRALTSIVKCCLIGKKKKKTRLAVTSKHTCTHHHS